MNRAARRRRLQVAIAEYPYRFGLGIALHPSCTLKEFRSHQRRGVCALDDDWQGIPQFQPMRSLSAIWPRPAQKVRATLASFLARDASDIMLRRLRFALSGLPYTVVAYDDGTVWMAGTTPEARTEIAEARSQYLSGRYDVPIDAARRIVQATVIVPPEDLVSELVRWLTPAQMTASQVRDSRVCTEQIHTLLRGSGFRLVVSTFGSRGLAADSDAARAARRARIDAEAARDHNLTLEQAHVLVDAQRGIQWAHERGVVAAARELTALGRALLHQADLCEPRRWTRRIGVLGWLICDLTEPRMGAAIQLAQRLMEREKA